MAGCMRLHRVYDFILEYRAGGAHAKYQRNTSLACADATAVPLCQSPITPSRAIRRELDFRLRYIKRPVAANCATSTWARDVRTEPRGLRRGGLLRPMPGVQNALWTAVDSSATSCAPTCRHRTSAAGLCPRPPRSSSCAAHCMVLSRPAAARDAASPTCGASGCWHPRTPAVAACRSSLSQGELRCNRERRACRARVVLGSAAATVAAATATTCPATAPAVREPARSDAWALIASRRRVTCASSAPTDCGGSYTGAAGGGGGQVVVYDLSDQVVDYEKVRFS